MLSIFSTLTYSSDSPRGWVLLPSHPLYRWENRGLEVCPFARIAQVMSS